MDKYKVSGMSCAACQARVEKAVGQVPGVDSCAVSLLTNTMGVEGTASAEDIIRAVEAAGYGASLQGGGQAATAGESAGAAAAARLAEQEAALEDHETPALRRRLLFSVLVLLVLMYGSMGHTMWNWPLPGAFAGNPVGVGLAEMMLATIILYINRKFFISGFRSLRHGAPNMDTLVAMGSGVSYLWSTLLLFQMTVDQAAGDSAAAMHGLHNLYFESAAMIVTLITVGKLLEAMSKGRTTDALKGLMRMAPQTAVVERDGAELELSITEVQVGDIFVVRAGAVIPVDGVILEGQAAVDESALTGESIPVDKGEGDIVTAATINRSGYLRARATRIGEDTTLAQIIRMVSDAAATKAPIARIADKVSGVFVPAVLIIAAIVVGLWLLAGQSLAYALARGISVLVISCPCALGLATPVAIMAGSGVGARQGILFKTAAALEETGRVAAIALDKTGTITRGEPAVTDILAAPGVERSRLLSIACGLEQRSDHPLAQAISSYGEAHPEELAEDVAVADFEELAGQGLRARLAADWHGAAGQKLLKGTTLYAGNQKSLSAHVSIDAEIQARAAALAGQGKTPLFFAAGDELLGVIAVADTIKEDSRRAIAELKGQGLYVVMLTGDNERTAGAIGGEAGVDAVIAGVLPDGKEAAIRRLAEHGRVAMVGDGINDAPALTRADVGIAIGAGADVALDAADVVLMNSRLSDVSAAVRLSRATLRNIHENLFWAFFYNVLLIPLAAGAYVHIMHGWSLNPMLGAAAMSLSSFCVCMNALRLNLCRVHDARRDKALRGRGGVDPALWAQVIQDIQGKGQGEAAGSKGKERGDMVKTLSIEGMMCPHCEATVQKALEALDGVTAAEVSHEENRAVVTMTQEVADDVLTRAVEDKDYTVTGIR